MSTLTEFLRKQKETENHKEFNADKVREEWLSTLTRLLGQIKQWLQEAEAERLIQVKEKQISITEDRLGTYTAPSLALTVGKDTIEINPIGRTIIGFNGRVDMQSTRGTISLFYSTSEDRWVYPAGTKPAEFPAVTESVFTDLLKRLLP